MKSRIGKFYISQVLIREEIEEVAKVLSILKFVPLRIEYLYNDTVEMVGHSHMFKELEDELSIVEYSLIITKKENGEIEVRV